MRKGTEKKQLVSLLSICLDVARVLESRLEICQKILNGKKAMLHQRSFIHSKSRQKRTEEVNTEHLPLRLLLYYLKEGKGSGVKMLGLLWGFQKGRSCSYTCKLTSWLQGLGELLSWWMMGNWVSKECSGNCSW